MAANKVDEMVEGMIEAIRARGRGWVLRLRDDAEDGAVNIAVEESLPPPDEWQRPADRRMHEIGDTASFIAYARRYGDPERSLVLFSDQGVAMILDEMTDRGEREVVRMGFRAADEWTAWSGAIGQALVHRQLLQFLNLWQHTLDNIDLLESMRTINATATVKHDSDLQESGDAVGVMFVTRRGEHLERFPRSIPLRLPVLDQDGVNEDDWVRATLRLDIEMPTEAGKPILFALHCSQWHMILRERVRREGELIAEALEGFAVVRGVPTYKRREIGPQARQSARVGQ